MNEPDELVSMIKAGGVYYNIWGETPEAVYTDMVSHLSLPSGVDPAALLSGLIERERLMTTSVGNGIALPHPRTPIVTEEKDQRVYVCFLDRPVNFDAMDGKPVFALFVILSNGSQSHLKVLSRLSWLFQQETFRETLRKKPDTKEMISMIQRYL
jgi:PTS system nitrogen regulatory IIA component